MKRVFLAVLLVLCLTGRMLYAEENSGVTSGFDWDIRFGISFPFVTNIVAYNDDNGEEIKALSVAGGMLSALVFSSLSLGVGFQYTIVPHVIAPGIYADVHFNAPSWFLVAIFTDWEQSFLLVQPGVRFYNNFQITKSFGIDPFYGINFMYININDKKETMPLMNGGFVLKGKSFAFEYCFIIPNKKTDKWTPSVHRIGFSWTLRDRD
jgi:hypothetical protein